MQLSYSTIPMLAIEDQNVDTMTHSYSDLATLYFASPTMARRYATTAEGEMLTQDDVTIGRNQGLVKNVNQPLLSRNRNIKVSGESQNEENNSPSHPITR